MADPSAGNTIAGIQVALSYTRPAEAIRFFRIAYLETRADYESSRLGLIWLPLSTVVFSGILGTIFHEPGKSDQATFFLYVISGYVAWVFISDTISGSVSIIQSKFESAIQVGLSLESLFIKTIIDRLFALSLNILVLLGSLILLRPSAIGVPVLLILPMAALFGLTGLALSYVINVLTLFLPDLQSLIKTVPRVLFFATPIFWWPDKAQGPKHLLDVFNPASAYVALTRQVFGIVPVAPLSWAVASAVSLGMCGLALATYVLSHKRVRNIK